METFQIRRPLLTLIAVSLLALFLLTPTLSFAARNGFGDFGRDFRSSFDSFRNMRYHRTTVPAPVVMPQIVMPSMQHISTPPAIETHTSFTKHPVFSKDTRISLRDLGLLQLAAHDFFNVNRDTEVDHENGKLDLSTLFDHGAENVALGGEGRNRENIILFSVASEFGKQYESMVASGMPSSFAKRFIVNRYRDALAGAYMRTFGTPLPVPQRGAATMTENLALRIVHDFLPGEIWVNGVLTPTLDPSLRHGVVLSDTDLMQQSAPLDGEFDPEFLNIEIFVPPGPAFTISLLERDSSFADQFNTDHSFEYFLAEVSDGQFDHNDKVMEHIAALFAKGMSR